MSEEYHENRAVTQFKRHQFTVLIVGSILTSLFLVFVALSLYVTSGTIQLDLSRPGFAEARKEAIGSGTVFKGFSPNGDINKAALDEFETLYNKKLKEATSVKAFSGDALSDKTLRLEE